MNQLRFGRGVDNRALQGRRASATSYTSRETVVKLGEHLRLDPVLRGAAGALPLRARGRGLPALEPARAQRAGKARASQPRPARRARAAARRDPAPTAGAGEPSDWRPRAADRRRADADAPRTREEGGAARSRVRPQGHRARQEGRAPRRRAAEDAAERAAQPRARARRRSRARSRGPAGRALRRSRRRGGLALLASLERDDLLALRDYEAGTRTARGDRGDRLRARPLVAPSSHCNWRVQAAQGRCHRCGTPHVSLH